MGELAFTTDATAALLDPMRSLPRWLADCLEALDLSTLRRPEIPSDKALTEPQRQHVEARLASLTSRLSPATERERAAAVAMVRSCLRSRQADDAGAEAEAAGYMLALSDMPAFAIQEAARRIIIGEAGLSKTFAPTPAEMRSVAVSAMAPAKCHARMLEKLLAAQTKSVEIRVSPERARELIGAIVLNLPEARRRGIPNPSGVDHSNKGGL